MAENAQTDTGATPNGASNCVDITGRIIERNALRYTPNGIPVLECRLEHRSWQEEAGEARRVDCEVPILALADHALSLNSAACPIRIGGFLAARSARVKQLIVHVTHVELIKGSIENE